VASEAQGVWRPSTLPGPRLGERHYFRIRRLDGLQELLARDGLDLRRVCLESVGFVAAAARLRDDPLQDMRLAATPELERHAVAALEIRREPQLVVLREGRGEHELAFLLRPRCHAG